MTAESGTDGTGMPDVPAQIFEGFLKALGEASVPDEVVARLRKTLVEDKRFTERALNDALFAEEVQS